MIDSDEVHLSYELQKLYNRYAQVLDDGPLEDWPNLFFDECLYLVTPRDNFDQGLPLSIMRCESRGMLEDRVRAIQETMFYEPRYLRHHISNIDIKSTEGRSISVTANFSVIEVLYDELPRILSVGRYLDTIERSERGGLFFREKHCIYDSVLVPNSIIFPL